MNKILEIIKNILMILVAYLIIKYLTIYDAYSNLLIIYLALQLLFIIINVRDYFIKEKIVHDKNYNILSIITLLIIAIVFIRCLFDKSFLFNNDNNLYYNTNILNMEYLYQNMIYFILMLSLLIIYHKKNISSINNQYNIIVIICMMISILQFFVFNNVIYNSLFYIILNIILIVIEIFFLIRDNHNMKEWPIYVSWLFNLLMIIGISFHLFFK